MKEEGMGRPEREYLKDEQHPDIIQALFDRTKQNAALLMDRHGVIQWVSKSFTQLFGYSESQLIAENFSLLFTWEDQEKGMPGKELRNVLLTGQGNDNNYIVEQSGKPTWVSGESILIHDSTGEAFILKIIQNIHRQKEFELSLQEVNELNTAILQSIDDIVVVVNKNLEILKANRSFYKLFDDKNTSPTFANFCQVLGIEQTLPVKIREITQSEIVHLKDQIECVLPSGTKKIFDLKCSILDGDEKSSNMLLIFHDITLYKETERQREDIIGFVAHELRNPLSNIVLSNDLMADSLRENRIEEALEYLNRCQSNVIRLNKMIAQLYHATKIGSGNIQLEMGYFDFDDMIREAVEGMMVLHPMNRITVHGQIGIRFHGDRYRLLEVVTNYLSNGIKYSGGSVDVDLEVKSDDRNILVSVQDRGLGISTEQLPLIFDRFFRAEKTKNMEGIGLGLYLCRQIIQAHGGKVWAESEEGVGSVFYFSIPLQK